MNLIFTSILTVSILPIFAWVYPTEESFESLTTISSRGQPQRRSCDGAYIEPGECINIKECPRLINELKRIPDNPDFKQYLRRLWELCGKTDRDVCCEIENSPKPNQTLYPKFTNEVPTRLPTPEEGCGYSSNFFNKIVGGEPSKIGGWPWIALIGSDDVLSNSPFICDGTIITARHVLTAAHCLRRSVTFVRLGEHDLSRDDETKHQDIKILRIERHPNYDKRTGRSDIALLYLERNVRFTELITPICLPHTSQLRNKSYANTAPFVAGWGKTSEGGKMSSILQQLKITIYDNELCKEKYQKRNLFRSEDQFDNAVICAGELAGGKDTCFGDSGGPLMTPEEYGRYARFYLIGIIAYSIGCARPDIPGVYTSTQYFMDWIEEKVADSE